MRSARCAALDRVVSDLFPGGGDVTRAGLWTGLRPMIDVSTLAHYGAPLR